MSDTYFRCKHCRGFYETSFEQCKWCNYETPMLDTAGQPRVFPDRESCRTIQVAEYEQIPEKHRNDGMGPPPKNLFVECECLHCGPRGHVFEAIEMRWIVNERMWACPCTTCGGRGFQFDIHPAGNQWECAQCGHFYTPEKPTHKYAHCPRCGCKEANGWFMEENEDGEPMTDEEYAEYEAKMGAEMEAEMAEERMKKGLPPLEEEITSKLDEEVPWEDDVKPYDPSSPDDDDDESMSGEEKMLDDIDFPREGIPEREEGESGGAAGGSGDPRDDIPF